MGAREDLLGAAARLTSRGQAPFSPADLIAEARNQGCNYPDTTLRTFIVGPMCVNSPDNHAVQYGDLQRVGRGQYRLVDGPSVADFDPATVDELDALDHEPLDEAAPYDTAEDWFTERRVQALVVRHLAAGGWEIRRVADTTSREHGIDIQAVRDGISLLVEVKGYPGATYARGERAGQPKRTAAPMQARAYFSNAVLAGMLMRNDAADARVAIAFPWKETYRNLARRTAAPLAAAGVEVWLVDEDGALAEIAPD